MKLRSDTEIDSRDTELGGRRSDTSGLTGVSDTGDLKEVDIPKCARPCARWRAGLHTIAATTKRTLRQGKTLYWRSIRAVLARWRQLALVIMVVAALALACALFFLQYRPNQQTNDAAARAAIRSASDGTVALLSYSPETVDNDVSAGKSHLTGELLRYFSDFSQYFVAPAVRQQGVRTSASVVRAAVVRMRPNSAVVLLFVHQTTTTKDKPDPVLTINSVRVTLMKVNGTWLIEKFEPE